jgi:hypothetical protein
VSETEFAQQRHIDFYFGSVEWRRPEQFISWIQLEKEKNALVARKLEKNGK